MKLSGWMLFLACGTAIGTAPQPQFKTGTELVTVDVIATDTNGHPVRHLTVADFEISEDGIPQPIQAFHYFDATSMARPPLPPGLSSNEVEPGGIFAVVLDEIGLEVSDVRDVRRTVGAFLRETMRPNDYAAVVRALTASGLLFSSDLRLALNALEGATGIRERGLGIENAASQPLPDSAAGILDQRTRFKDVESVSGGASGRKSFDILLEVVEKLRTTVARRKAILWVSRGGELAFRSTEDLERGLAEGRADARFVRLIDAARAANVAIYSMDPRGLVAPAKSDAAPPDLGTLRDIATATGGRALVNTNDLAGALVRVAEENRAYYLLGYIPTATHQRARRLQVRTRVPGVSLLHRTMYVPIDPKKPVPPVPLAASLLPVRDLPITIAPAAAIDRRKALGVVASFLIGNGLAMDQEVEYTVIALDLKGRQVGKVDGTAKAINGAVSGTVKMPLGQGLYQMRLAAGVKGSATKGLAVATVVVPQGKSDPSGCAGFVLQQPDAHHEFRRFIRARALTITTLLSAKSVPRTGITFGIGTPGRAPERMFPVSATRAADGLWQLALTLEPPLPRGLADVAVFVNGLPLGDTCRTTFRMGGEP